ncbi:MAG: hypothetical protein ACOCWI_00440 [Bacillota bacterium]
MPAGIIVLIAVSAAIFGLILFMLIRAMFIKPIQIDKGSYNPIKINKDKLAKKLSDAVKIPTLTVLEEGMSYEPFLEFHKFLENAFPKFHSKAEKKIINNYSLVYKIEGKTLPFFRVVFLPTRMLCPPLPKVGM